MTLFPQQITPPPAGRAQEWEVPILIVAKVPVGGDAPPPLGSAKSFPQQAIVPSSRKPQA
jgi:hypothetical protein